MEVEVERKEYSRSGCQMGGLRDGQIGWRMVILPILGGENSNICHFHPHPWGNHQLVQEDSDAMISNIAACIVHPSIMHADTATLS